MNNHDAKPKADDAESLSTAGLRVCRPVVAAFALAMEAKMRKNDWKAPWQGMGLQYLSMRLTQEREELRRAAEAGDPDEVLREAADVANFAMMIADHVRRNPKTPNVEVTGAARLYRAASVWTAGLCSIWVQKKCSLLADLRPNRFLGRIE